MTTEDETLWVEETFVNETKGHQFGNADPYEAWTADVGKLFRTMQREYGGCTGKIGTDIRDADGNPTTIFPIGWVFERWERYEDSRETCPECQARLNRHREHYCYVDGRRRGGEKDFYLRQVWVTVYRGNPHQVTRTTLETPVYALAGGAA